MRVYELAKKLGMDSRALIPELVRLGIEVTSHSNTLGDDDVKKSIDGFVRTHHVPLRKERIPPQ